MKSNIDAVARRQSAALQKRCTGLEKRIASLETALQRLYGVVPPPPLLGGEVD